MVVHCLVVHELPPQSCKLIRCFVFPQHCPPGRFLMLMGAGALLYLTGMGPLQRALQRLIALALPAPIRAPQAGQGAAAGQPPPAPQWTFFGELQAVIVGFFSSLIPGMAVAQAQAMPCYFQFLPKQVT